MADQHKNLYEKYVWEVPVRVTHWVNVLAIITLAVTGIYIGAPKTLGLTASDYYMGWVRFVHFVAAYTFAISVASRIYWALVGNRYASWRENLPLLTPHGRQEMWETFTYYTFLSKKAPHVVGHNALAGLAYLVLYGLFLMMILTGFALYAEHAPGGIMHVALTPLYKLFSNQGMRLTHHMTMWFIIGFAIQHIYSVWLMDIKERGGVISSIFGGYKAVQKRD